MPDCTWRNPYLTCSGRWLNCEQSRDVRKNPTSDELNMTNKQHSLLLLLPFNCSNGLWLTERRCFSTKYKSCCISLFHMALCYIWKVQPHSFCMTAPQQKQWGIPSHKEEEHLSVREQARFLSCLSRLWSLDASFSKRVILMLSLLHCSRKNSYFWPNNWQIKDKDQLTKRNMNSQQSNVIVCSCHFLACSQF